MTGSHSRKIAELSPGDLRVHFPEALRKSFGDLAAAVQFSEHFDQGHILSIIQDWSSGRTTTVQGFAMALPEIAEETLKHIQATDDERAAQAWEDIKLEIGERSFTLEKIRRHGRERAGG